MNQEFIIEYKTTNKAFPIIKADREIDKGDFLELQHERFGIILFQVESIVDDVLELEEYSPILITV